MKESPSHKLEAHTKTFQLVALKKDRKNSLALSADRRCRVVTEPPKSKFEKRITC
jgi:hypothetical protein